MPGIGSRRKNRGGQKKPKFAGKRKQDDRDTRPQISYKDIVRENPSYEAYYKAQKIVPEEDWAKFMNTIRDPLPAAFRITSYFGGQAKVLRDMVEGDHFKKLVKKEDENSKSEEPLPDELGLTCLPWYPNRFGWQINMSRIEIRRNEAALRLHNFLISESESGFINRQEAVSMIPPLLLDVKPHHKVLDMCAAPGSKTAQIIEMLHADEDKSFATGTGVVVANDVDNKRCYMLVHQSKRLHSPGCIITNHDAGQMPNFYETIDGVKKELKFDRVLCDAPCTGDGTIRKNIDVWMKWNPANANNFHGIQTRIAKRGLELLAKDGLMVYSTCSLSPMEDEAVVASLLNQSEGGLELVDVSEKLPGLKSSPGLTSWVMMTRELEVYTKFEDVAERHQTQIRESMFPPKNAADLNLQRCMRILPHLQDTGGFFVAVLKKTVERLPWEHSTVTDAEVKSTPTVEENKNSEEAPKEQRAPKRPRQRFAPGSFKEDPFMFFNDESPEWPGIKDYYKINDEFPHHQLMYRNDKGKKRNIYFLTEAAKRIIVDNDDRIKFINAGARLFARNPDKDAVACGYRLSQEGLPSVYPYVDKKTIVTVETTDIEALLATDSVSFDKFSDISKPAIDAMPPGSCILLFKTIFKSDELLVPICCWKGKNTVRPYIAKNERLHFLRICGVDTSDLGNLAILFFADC